MPAIHLSNLTKPRQTQNQVSDSSKRVSVESHTYTDLHLDIIQSTNIGLGLSTTTGKDIIVDNDIEAIRNSLKNIFSTRKGQKILTPEFGSSLDQFLFQPITNVNANSLGNLILETIQRFEPRITINKILVNPLPDFNTYKIQMFYSFIQINKNGVGSFSFHSHDGFN